MRTFELLSLMNHPQMAAPWDSKDEGEAFVWGDFVMTLQKDPKVVHQIAAAMTGEDSEFDALRHVYAMTVFYKKDRNPHGPSSRPVLSISFEQCNYGSLASMLGGDAQSGLSAALEDLGIGDMEPSPMLCMFFEDNHVNMGDVEGGISVDNAKMSFFKAIGQTLGLSGEPVYIGSIAEVHGHPQSGFPEQKKKGGCAALFAGFALTGISLGYATAQLIS